jgi:hypothetical protein
LDAFTLLHRFLWVGAGVKPVYNLQLVRLLAGTAEGIFGDDGIAVHRRPVERRSAVYGDNILRQHPAQGIIQFQRFGAANGRNAAAYNLRSFVE